MPRRLSLIFRELCVSNGCREFDSYADLRSIHVVPASLECDWYLSIGPYLSTLFQYSVVRRTLSCVINERDLPTFSRHQPQVFTSRRQLPPATLFAPGISLLCPIARLPPGIEHARFVILKCLPLDQLSPAHAKVVSNALVHLHWASPPWFMSVGFFDAPALLILSKCGLKVYFVSVTISRWLGW